MLDLQSISMSVGGIKILNRITQEFHGGAIYGLIGPNGAGKTTLFNVISGFVRQDEGQILFEGKRVDSLRPETRWQLGISRSFQDCRLARSLTAAENIGLAVRGQVGETLIGALSRVPRIAADNRRVRALAGDLLEDCGLGAVMDREAGTLSFGQRRMVSIACCMIAKPRLLLLDEPATGLSPPYKQYLRTMITSYSRTSNACVIIIGHDIAFLEDVVTTALFMNLGEIVFEGEIEELRVNPIVIDSYFGKMRSVVDDRL